MSQYVLKCFQRGSDMEKFSPWLLNIINSYSVKSEFAWIKWDYLLTKILLPQYNAKLSNHVMHGRIISFETECGMIEFLLKWG